MKNCKIFKCKSENTNEDCIFCKILNKKAPSYKIYEDKYVYAFLDISCDIEGHTLIIPKKHSCDVLDCDEKYLKQIIIAAKKIGKHFVENCGYDGFNIVHASRKSAEQSVFHLHFHIIPRKENDQIKMYPELEKKDFNLEEIANKLKLN